MKKITMLIAAGAMILTTSLGCKKQPIDLLPPATQEGKNILGALIDGNLYSAKNEYKGNPMFFCNSHVKWNQGGLSGTYISSRDCEGKKYGDIYIYVYRTDIAQGQTYEIGDPTIEGISIDFAGVNPLETFYHSDANNKGSITFTRYDNEVVAGTFQSQAIGYIGADSGKVVQVTNGRFDIKR